MKHGADAFILGRKCVTGFLAQINIPSLLGLVPGRTRVTLLRKSSPMPLGANASSSLSMSGNPRPSKQRPRGVLRSMERLTLSSAVSLSYCGQAHGLLVPSIMLKWRIGQRSGAAGNFLAPISGLSENAFRTVIEIDTVSSFG